MKNKYLIPVRFLTTLCLLLITATFLFAQSLKPTEKNALFNHLVEINKEWQHYSANLENQNVIYSFDNDEQRIQLHLQLVHKILKQKNTDHLSESQRSKRLRHLSVLEKYWKASVFPINTLDHHRQPYFVDYNKNACAVGYLMQKDGQNELVQKIHKEHNFDYVEELVKYYPVIELWASDNGFTIAELAWIQPGYSPPEHHFFAIGNGGGIVGKINVMKTNNNGSLLYMAGQFSEVDGVSANSIIAWNGQSWQTLGSGVDGEILDIDTDGAGNVYVAGNFLLNSDPSSSNIAVWDGNSWTGLQQGDMGGSVRTILKDGFLFVGGDFEMIDGESIPYLARGNNGSWTNSSVVYIPPSTYDTVANAFAVNGPVNDIVKVESRILIAGEFTKTAPDAIGTSVNKFDTDHLAYWFNGNWEVGFFGSYQEVETAAYIDEKIFIGGNEPGDDAYSIFTAGFWNSRNLEQLDNSPGAGASTIRGFVEHNGRIYAYGNIANVPLLGIFSTGLVQVGSVNINGGNQGGSNFDRTVRACEVFQNNVYFAGDFTWAGSDTNTFNGMAYSPLEISSATENNNNFPIDIYTANKQLHIQYENLSKSTQLQVYNLQGRLVHSLTLDSGAATLQEDLSHLNEGVFVYELTDGNTRSSAKISVF